MPVVTRVTGCVVCAVLVARGPYEGTRVLTAIRVVAVSRSRGFVNGYSSRRAHCCTNYSLRGPGGAGLREPDSSHS